MAEKWQDVINETLRRFTKDMTANDKFDELRRAWKERMLLSHDSGEIVTLHGPSLYLRNPLPTLVEADEPIYLDRPKEQP